MKWASEAEIYSDLETDLTHLFLDFTEGYYKNSSNMQQFAEIGEQ